jgi:hypothetical protein
LLTLSNKSSGRRTLPWKAPRDSNHRAEVMRLKAASIGASKSAKQLGIRRASVYRLLEISSGEQDSS